MDFDNVLDFDDPLLLAQKWLTWAGENTGMTYPNAMSLATVSSDGRPSIRTVLLKEITNKGFVFFTNYESRKGLEISKNSAVAANFYWDKPFRQIKIQGQAKPLSREDSVAYWQSRPRESQISQYVSKQSRPVATRELLDSEYDHAVKQLEGKEVDCPKHWGGYLIEPSEVIFWIGKLNRFHDCYRFTGSPGQNWLAERLYP